MFAHLVRLFVCLFGARAMRMRWHFKVSGKPPFFGCMLTLTQIALRNCVEQIFLPYLFLTRIEKKMFPKTCVLYLFFLSG